MSSEQTPNWLFGGNLSHSSTPHIAVGKMRMWNVWLVYHQLHIVRLLSRDGLVGQRIKSEHLQHGWYYMVLCQPMIYTRWTNIGYYYAYSRWKAHYSVIHCLCSGICHILNSINVCNKYRHPVSCFRNVKSPVCPCTLWITFRST